MVNRVAAIVLVSLSAFGTHASAAHRAPVPGQSPCGLVDLSYSSHVVHAGDLFDMDLTIENCSDIPEHLLLKVQSAGPCPFPHPRRAVYDLGPHEGVGSSALVIAPECPGPYRVRVGLVLADRPLDRDAAGFRVVTATP
jgi:hypothetical protein